MALGTITNTVTKGDRTQPTHLRVTATLTPEATTAYGPDGVEVDLTPVTISVAGPSWSLTLERTDTMEPAGMLWAILEEEPSTGWSSVTYARVLAAPQTLEQAQATPAAIIPTALTEFDFSQPAPLDPWVINHNLGRYPSVTITDTLGSVVEADVQYTTANQVVITFGAPFAGSAHLS